MFFPAAIQGDDIIGMIIGVAMMMIPIVAILTRHQQKMTELMHRREQTGQIPQAEAQLHAEVMALRQLVAQQALALDDLAQSQRALAKKLDTSDIRERLSQG